MYGSGVVIPGTGVQNNFMNWGDLNLSSPNFFTAARVSACAWRPRSPATASRCWRSARPAAMALRDADAGHGPPHDLWLGFTSRHRRPAARLWDGRRNMKRPRRGRCDGSAARPRPRHSGHRAVFDVCGGMQAITLDPASALTGAADSPATAPPWRSGPLFTTRADRRSDRRSSLPGRRGARVPFSDSP